MVVSIFIIACLLCGVAAQIFIPGGMHMISPLMTPVIITLLILVGVQMGSDLSWLQKWRTHMRSTFIISACTVIGSLAIAVAYAFFDPTLHARDAMLVASGLGFYSLSSILLDHAGLQSLAVLSLISNLLREVLSLAAAPWIVRYFGVLAPIAATASASDSGAPVITRSSGSEHTALCVSTAFVLSICVPVLVQVLLMGT